MSFKWILIGVLVLVLFGYVSVQGPGVSCGASTTWEKEQFTDGKDMWPSVPKFSDVAPATIRQCPDNTRARDGRCSEFLGP